MPGFDEVDDDEFEKEYTRRKEARKSKSTSTDGEVILRGKYAERWLAQHPSYQEGMDAEETEESEEGSEESKSGTKGKGKTKEEPPPVKKRRNFWGDEVE